MEYGMFTPLFYYQLSSGQSKINSVYYLLLFLVNDELQATGKFELMDLRVDEAEHSMEMHLPYLAKVFNG